VVWGLVVLGVLFVGGFAVCLLRQPIWDGVS
jgi:hypothetical protein